ncbi:hypothetical protein GE09DRAFT_1154464 [Coniochaeta sp. 2T2.1]|nr:hypothetical protein GE09DRAFT_1154464 [Coniochaeta sp. 2T2.1]
MGLRDLVRRGKRPLLVAAKDDMSMPEDSDRVTQTRHELAGGQAEGHGGPSSGTNPVDTASQELDDTESASKDADPAPESLAWDSLWAEAYETLKADPEYTELLAEFERTVMGGKDGAADAAKKASLESGGITEGTEKLNQIQELAQEKLQKLPEARLSFSIGDKRIVVRDAVRKTISAVTAFKDVISSAISAEPGAGLAWAGIMSILPLVENSFRQDDDAESGLKNIVFLLIRYQRLQEGILVPESQKASLSESACRVFSEIRTKLISVYAQVYVFEIRFVLQYSRGRAYRAARNVMAADDWKGIWADIESTSQMIDQGVREHVGARTLEAVNDIITRAENIENLQHLTLESVTAGNQTQLILTLPCAMNAIFDSAEVTGKEVPCLNGTRRDVLNRIQDWAENPTGEAIFWLHGMAGTGKTSVALTVSTALNARQPFTEGRQPPRSAFLGASFFFKQGDTTRNGTKTFFPTLARRLAQGFPDLGTQIADAVAKNLEIGTKAPQQQLDCLVFRPLSVVDEKTFIPVRLVVVVDALDECIEQKEVDDLISMLRALEDLHQVQLRVLITSRRDDHILRSFEKLPIEMYSPLLLDKVRSPVKEDDEVDDITKYLIHTLGKIASERGVPASWIDEDGIVSLNKKADGLFIYAATMCRYLDCEDFDDEEARDDRLEQILGDEMETDAPQQKVDEIYLKVLSFPHLAKLTRKSQMKFHDKTKRILGFITAFFEPVSVLSLSALLSVDKEELNKTLRKFHSVLDVPQDEHAPLGLVHLSFRDFLLSEERSGKLPFRIEEISMHRAVFDACLGLMSRELRQDMCELILPGHLASDVPHSQVERGVPRYLQYACRYWVDHLARLSNDQRKDVGLADGKAAHLFLREKLLFWLEAMSLIRETSAAILIINKLGTMVDSTENPILSRLVYDAGRFVLSNKYVIEKAPLQLYSSALIFSPSKSEVRSQFRHLIPSWITHAVEVEEDWTPELYTLEGHGSSINSTAFSPVDDLLASGSRDNTTRIWDYITGTELYKFEESSTVFFVVFSTDGKTVASGLHDGVIRLREFSKGRSIDLIGHTDLVSGIAFAPKSSSTLVSVSDDKTLRIWNIEKEQTAYIFHVQQNRTPILALSPGGEFVAVETGDPFDGAVTLWGVEKGELRTTFHRIDSALTAISISMDGEIVILASEYRMVEVWNVETGQMLHDTDYEDRIEAILFCPPDGEYVAIVLSSGTVELRRAETWDHVGNFITDSNPRGLSLSRDSQFLATAFADNNTIRLYDMTANTSRAGRDVSREGRVISVEFFPGKDNVVMSTSDTMTQFWNATSTPITSLPASVSAARFSLDERFVGLEIINGAVFHGTVQLWSQCMARKIASYDDADWISFSPDSSHVALRSMRKTRIVDSTTLEETVVLNMFWPYCFEFSPDGRFAAWLDAPGEIRFLDLTSSEEHVELTSFSANDFTFSPDGELVMLWKRYGLTTDNISLLEVSTGKERAAFPGGHPDHRLSTFHPAGHLVLAGETDISIWNTASGGNIHTLKLDAFDECEFQTLAFSKAGELIAASVTARGEAEFQTPWAIQLWNFATGTGIGILRFDMEIPHLSFSGDSRYLMTRKGWRLPLPPAITSQGARLDDTSLAESCIYVAKKWIVQGLDNILWLPPALRKPHPAVRDETIAFARRKGEVAYLRLDLAKTPLARRTGAFREVI